MQGPINIGKVMSAHAKFRRGHADMIAKETRRAGEFGVQYVQQRPTFRPRTRNLQRQTEYKLVRLSNGVIIKLRNKAKYARAIDLGARPHRIAARRARALRFMWHGHLIFRRYVTHPGNRPFRFLYKAANATGRVLEGALRHQMQQLAKKF